MSDPILCLTRQQFSPSHNWIDNFNFLSDNFNEIFGAIILWHFWSDNFNFWRDNFNDILGAIILWHFWSDNFNEIILTLSMTRSIWSMSHQWGNRREILFIIRSSSSFYPVTNSSSSSSNELTYSYSWMEWRQEKWSGHTQNPLFWEGDDDEWDDVTNDWGGSNSPYNWAEGSIG